MAEGVLDGSLTWVGVAARFGTRVRVAVGGYQTVGVGDAFRVGALVAVAEAILAAGGVPVWVGVGVWRSGVGLWSFPAARELHQWAVNE